MGSPTPRPGLEEQSESESFAQDGPTGSTEDLEKHRISDDILSSVKQERPKVEEMGAAPTLKTGIISTRTSTSAKHAPSSIKLPLLKRYRPVNLVGGLFRGSGEHKHWPSAPSPVDYTIHRDPSEPTPPLPSEFIGKAVEYTIHLMPTPVTTPWWTPKHRFHSSPLWTPGPRPSRLTSHPSWNSTSIHTSSSTPASQERCHGRRRRKHKCVVASTLSSSTSKSLTTSKTITTSSTVTLPAHHRWRDKHRKTHSSISTSTVSRSKHHPWYWYSKNGGDWGYPKTDSSSSTSTVPLHAHHRWHGKQPKTHSSTLTSTSTSLFVAAPPLPTPIQNWWIPPRIALSPIHHHSRKHKSHNHGMQTSQEVFLTIVKVPAHSAVPMSDTVWQDIMSSGSHLVERSIPATQQFYIHHITTLVTTTVPQSSISHNAQHPTQLSIVPRNNVQDDTSSSSSIDISQFQSSEKVKGAKNLFQSLTRSLAVSASLQTPLILNSTSALTDVAQY